MQLKLAQKIKADSSKINDSGKIQLFWGGEGYPE